jgi:glycosyltransferase involved in cell wall biosynthesis
VRILLVSAMYPGPDDPDLGVFVQGLERALAARGHEIERAVLTSRAGGRRRWLLLARRARVSARRFRPEVVYAHFLVPTGLLGAIAARVPLVVTAHGQDVANVGSILGVRAATRLVVRRASGVVVVSDYLRRELEASVPEARGKTSVIDGGVDLDRFMPEPAPPRPTRFLCVGSLTERKNVLRLARAFETLGEGTLTFVGDGPLRGELEGRPGVVVAGRVAHDEVPRRLADAHVVCQPSVVEPFGQAVLEAMAAARTVVATQVGGPREFVPADAGVLVDPLEERSIAAGMRRAAELPCPNPAARAAAELHDVNVQARRVEEVLVRAVRDRRA